MSRSRTWKPRKKRNDSDEPEEREPILPPGWHVPTEAQCAAQTELRKRQCLRLYRDGWRRKLKDGMWYPCDSYGLRDPVTRVVIDGREKAVCRRRPIREGDSCSITPVQDDGTDYDNQPAPHWQDDSGE